MGRTKNRRSRTRDTTAIARPSRRFELDDYSFGPNLRQIEDRRSWDPEPYTRPARSATGSRHRLTVPSGRSLTSASRTNPYVTLQSSQWLPTGVAFENPKGVTICERRSRRRETLFALNKTGRGGQNRPRWTEYSSIQCKRRK